MNQKLIEIFQKIDYKPEARLASDIWVFLVRRERRIARLKLALFSALGSLSFIGIIPVFKILLLDFTKSGFYEYFSLIFSSNGVFATSWKELAYSLAESLPISSIVLLFSVIFIFFLSIRYLLKQIIKGQLSLAFN